MTLPPLSRIVTELIRANHIANRFSYILQASADTLDPQRNPPGFKTWVISLRYNYPEDMRFWQKTPYSTVYILDTCLYTKIACQCEYLISVKLRQRVLFWYMSSYSMISAHIWNALAHMLASVNNTRTEATSVIYTVIYYWNEKFENMALKYAHLPKHQIHDWPN